ncbi:hypothetical protein L3X38_034985 [Prunus dulcis]|uniref:Serine aminopeptidase S33 domain-containing protein n=1 Tax=Prunus dulcis TaxID=3755 RepID=A0AAD4YY82_PRUDU|nr:hypothetical protein L3X38_034985 [Prunus dulcis]
MQALRHVGYAVFAADLLGHGRSDGLRCYLGDMEKVAATSLSFFLHVRRNELYLHLPAFLFGESMGGAATMLMYFQSPPDTWTGLIFSVPLFVIPENMKPQQDFWLQPMLLLTCLVDAVAFVLKKSSKRHLLISNFLWLASSSPVLYKTGISKLSASLKSSSSRTHIFVEGERGTDFRAEEAGEQFDVEED